MLFCANAEIEPHRRLGLEAPRVLAWKKMDAIQEPRAGATEDPEVTM